MSRVAVVAAIERELRPLVKSWSSNEKQYEGRRLKFYENGNAVAVCAGIGSEAARRAAEAVIALYTPDLIYSVGFVGALNSAVRVGDLIRPQRVVNAGDGSSIVLEGGQGVLVSFGSVASPEQKARLRQAYAAQAVDMEASAVAHAADARGIRFGVVKAVSDDFDFELPPMEHFVDAAGQFLQLRFTLFAAVRPWMWPKFAHLARNSARAAEALCGALQRILSENFIGTSDTYRK